jgi:hypothetical protein
MKVWDARERVVSAQQVLLSLIDIHENGAELDMDDVALFAVSAEEGLAELLKTFDRLIAGHSARTYKAEAEGAPAADTNDQEV